MPNPNPPEGALKPIEGNRTAPQLKASPVLRAVSLKALCTTARDAIDTACSLNRRASEAAVAAGEAVAKAKETAGRDWPTWRVRSGMREQDVRNVLTLHRLALGPGGVVALGGIGLALFWAEGATLPQEGEALAVTVDATAAGKEAGVCYVWRVPGGFCAGRIPLHGPKDEGLVTRDPLPERNLWATVWHLLGYRFRDMGFWLIPEEECEASSILENVEERRQAILARGVGVLH